MAREFRPQDAGNRLDLATRETNVRERGTNAYHAGLEPPAITPNRSTTNRCLENRDEIAQKRGRRGVTFRAEACPITEMAEFLHSSMGSAIRCNPGKTKACAREKN